MKIVEDQLEEQDNEVERLKKVYKESYNAIYHADKTDLIDVALGNALNQYPEREKLKIMFLRESEGVY